MENLEKQLKLSLMFFDKVRFWISIDIDTYHKYLKLNSTGGHIANVVHISDIGI